MPVKFNLSSIAVVLAISSFICGFTQGLEGQYKNWSMGGYVVLSPYTDEKLVPVDSSMGGYVVNRPLPTYALETTEFPVGEFGITDPILRILSADRLLPAALVVSEFQI